MKLRRLLTPSILAALAFVILLLILNLTEVDYYPGARREPPPESDFPTQMPIGISESTHCLCVCSDCRHPVQEVTGRMAFHVVDQNGWYRLFWSGPVTYYFAEPSNFLTALENSTCTEPGGSWSVTITYDPRCAGSRPVLFCFSEVPRRVKLEYAARIVESPPDSIEFVSDPQGLLRIPARVIGPGRELSRSGKIVFIEWSLCKPPEVTYGPCECPR